MASAINALTALNEIATNIGQRIKEEVSNTGPDNNKTFTSVLTLDGVQGTGTGKTKKEAKHRAGVHLLENLKPKHGALLPKRPTSPQSPPSPYSSNSAYSPGSPYSPVSPSGTINYKGKLQEMMQKNRFPLPTYKYTKIGPPQFTVKCIVYYSNGELMDEVFGNGSSKKEAESDAAKSMINRVKRYIDCEGLTPPRRHISRPTETCSGPVDPVEIDELVAQLVAKGCHCPKYCIRKSESSGPDSVQEQLCLASVHHSEPNAVQSQCRYDITLLPIVAHGRGETEHQAKMQALLHLIDNVNTLLPETV